MIARRTQWAICICALLFLGGCGKAPKPRPKPVGPKPIAVKRAPPTPLDRKHKELGGPTWRPTWDTLIERSLPHAMLTGRVPRDVRRFCPAFYRMSTTDRRAFWAYFFQALASAESGLDARTNVRHSDMAPQRESVTKLPIRSDGLLQLTYEDGKRYGCNFSWKHDRRLPLEDPRRTILKPRNNLLCGIRILHRQIISRHEPLFTRYSYWSTLQPGTISYRVFAKQMTHPPAACGLRKQTAER